MCPGNCCCFLNLVVSVNPSNAWLIFWLLLHIYAYRLHPVSPNPPAVSYCRLALCSFNSSLPSRRVLCQPWLSWATGAFSTEQGSVFLMPGSHDRGRCHLIAVSAALNQVRSQVSTRLCLLYLESNQRSTLPAICAADTCSTNLSPLQGRSARCTLRPEVKRPSLARQTTSTQLTS